MCWWFLSLQILLNSTWNWTVEEPNTLNWFFDLNSRRSVCVWTNQAWVGNLNTQKKCHWIKNIYTFLNRAFIFYIPSWKTNFSPLPKGTFLSHFDFPGPFPCKGGICGLVGSWRARFKASNTQNNGTRHLLRSFPSQFFLRLLQHLASLRPEMVLVWPILCTKPLKLTLT